MDPLAKVSDVVARVGRDLTDAEVSRVESLLRDASAIVRGKDVTGQDFTRATTMQRRRIIRDHVILPQRPVNSIVSVQHPALPPDNLQYDVSRWRWNGLETVYLFLWNPETDFEMPWRPGYDVVDVTYDHGYDEIPDVVVTIVCNMVMRAFGVAPDESLIVLERIQGYEYRRADEAVAGIVGILQDERNALKPYGAGSRVGTVRLL